MSPAGEGDSLVDTQTFGGLGQNKEDQSQVGRDAQGPCDVEDGRGHVVVAGPVLLLSSGDDVVRGEVHPFLETIE